MREGDPHLLPLPAAGPSGQRGHGEGLRRAGAGGQVLPHRRRDDRGQAREGAAARHGRPARLRVLRRLGGRRDGACWRSWRPAPSSTSAASARRPTRARRWSRAGCRPRSRPSSTTTSPSTASGCPRRAPARSADPSTRATCTTTTSPPSTSVSALGQVRSRLPRPRGARGDRGRSPKRRKVTLLWNAEDVAAVVRRRSSPASRQVPGLPEGALRLLPDGRGAARRRAEVGHLDRRRLRGLRPAVHVARLGRRRRAEEAPRSRWSGARTRCRRSRRSTRRTARCASAPRSRRPRTTTTRARCIARTDHSAVPRRRWGTVDHQAVSFVDEIVANREGACYLWQVRVQRRSEMR